MAILLSNSEVFELFHENLVLNRKVRGDILATRQEDHFLTIKLRNVTLDLVSTQNNSCSPLATFWLVINCTSCHTCRCPFIRTLYLQTLLFFGSFKFNWNSRGKKIFNFDFENGIRTGLQAPFACYYWYFPFFFLFLLLTFFFFIVFSFEYLFQCRKTIGQVPIWNVYCTCKSTFKKSYKNVNRWGGQLFVVNLFIAWPRSSRLSW